MEWSGISALIVIAVVCFAGIIAAVLMISYLIYTEETGEDLQQGEIEEEEIIKQKIFSSF